MSGKIPVLAGFKAEKRAFFFFFNESSDAQEVCFPNLLCEFMGGGRKSNPSSKVSGPA